MEVIKLGDILKFVEDKEAPNYLEPVFNDKPLKEAKEGIDYFYDVSCWFTIGMYDGEAGLYVKVIDRMMPDPVILFEYIDSFISAYRVAKYSDVKDYVVAVKDEVWSVRTPSREEFERDHWVVIE